VQFDRNGDPLWSETRDAGACQINIPIHNETAEKMGLDVVNSEQDNIAYAKYLYDKNGTRDWIASKACWKRKSRFSG